MFLLQSGARNAANHNNERIQVTNRRWVDSDSIYEIGDGEKITAAGKISLRFMCKSRVYIQSERYPDWWTTLCLMVFEQCLNFTVALAS